MICIHITLTFEDCFLLRRVTFMFRLWKMKNIQRMGEGGEHNLILLEMRKVWCSCFCFLSGKKEIVHTVSSTLSAQTQKYKDLFGSRMEYRRQACSSHHQIVVRICFWKISTNYETQKYIGIGIEGYPTAYARTCYCERSIIIVDAAQRMACSDPRV